MIDLEFVQSLIRALDDSSLDSLELERGGTRIRLSKSAASPVQVGTASGIPAGANPAPPVEATNPSVAEMPAVAPNAQPAATEPEAPEENYIEVTSPMVGTFYRSPSPDAPPYVDVGSRVGEGTVLCIIEAMKLMNELESEMKGTVARILVENAEPVEYGQVLFLIDPS